MPKPGLWLYGPVWPQPDTRTITSAADATKYGAPYPYAGFSGTVNSALRQFPQLHTNPLNVQIGDAPIRASRRSALWCIETIERLREQRRHLTDALGVVAGVVVAELSRAGEPLDDLNLRRFELAGALAHLGLEHLVLAAVGLQGYADIRIVFVGEGAKKATLVRQVRARFTLQSLKDLGSGVEAVYGVTVEAQGEAKPCCVAEWIVRYYP